MARIPVAVQLWSVREEAKQDLPGTLKALAEMGYDGVEFAGYYGRSAEELKAFLDEFGLKAAGSHVGEDALRPDQVAQTIAFHQTLGNTFLIIPWKDPNDDPEVWKQFARFLDEAAAALASHALHTGYHNHGHEFHALDGATAWDLVAQHSGEGVVLQLDLGNAAHGGGDPVAYLKKYLSRARSVHLKEYSATKEKPLVGEGDIPWPEVLDLCEGSGVTEWYVVEQEVYPVPPMEAVKRCREFLRSLGR
jgi:sugar phosphate isomerase/epimerase